MSVFASSKLSCTWRKQTYGAIQGTPLIARAVTGAWESAVFLGKPPPRYEAAAHLQNIRSDQAGEASGLSFDRICRSTPPAGGGDPPCADAAVATNSLIPQSAHGAKAANLRRVSMN